MDVNSPLISLLINKHFLKLAPHVYQDFSNLVKNLENVLIIFPEDKGYFSTEILFLHKIRKVIPSAKFTVLLKEDSNSPSQEGVGWYIKYSDKELTFMNLIKKRLVKRIKLQNFDTLIDLNKNNTLVTRYLIANHYFPLRIGLHMKENCPYFNLMVKSKEEDSDEHLYNLMIHILTNYL